MTITIQEIKDRTDEVGECWIWKQGTTNGYPQLKVPGRTCKLVRRLVVELDGRPAEVRQPVITTCGDPMCVNPAHLRQSSTSEVGKRTAAAGGWKGKARGSKIAAKKRATGKLTMEIAREIRMSVESGPVLSARYGVDKSLVNRIKRGHAWKDYTNPFGGLM